MMKKTLVILKVMDDDDRPWWETLGLPDPVRWDGEMADTTYVEVVLEAKLTAGE